jgi:hypothetical protein
VHLFPHLLFNTLIFVLKIAFVGFAAAGVGPCPPVTLRPWRLPPRCPLTPPGSRPSTTFDHPYFATADIERLRAKLPETNLGFALAPTQATMSTLRDIVSAALGYRVAPTNRARVMERRDLIEPTGPTAPTGPTCGRPAVVYHFRSRQLEVADPYAILRPPAAPTRGWRCPAMPHLGRGSMIT